MPEKNYQKYITLLCLYIAQAVPLSFFTTVVPVIMRTENYSLEAIGLLQLVKLPWILKFLWAPLVDKTSVSLRGYTRWILYSELFYAMTIVAVGCLNLETNFMLIAVLVIIAITASATQDIATDAMAIVILKKHERSWGNSMQSAGGFIGTLLGSGVLLLMYHRFGWTVLMVGLALFVLMALVPLYVFKLKKSDNNKPPKTKPIRYADIYLFFNQKGVWRQLVLLVIFYSGITGILVMLKPFMVDLRYNLEQIGFMSGIVGTSIAAVCAIAAGGFIKKIGLKHGALVFSTFMLITAMYFFWLTTVQHTTLLLYVAIGLLWGTYGMSMVVVYTTSMNYVRQGCEGTDFTLQTVIAHLGSLLFAVASGKLAGKFGYNGLFAIEVILATITLLYVAFVYKKSEY